MQSIIDALDKKYFVNYELVTQEAAKWTTYATGVGLDELLKQFNRREGEEEFNQRKELTIHTSKSITNKVSNGFKKVYRASGVKSIVKGKSQVELETAIKDFTNKRTLTSVLEEAYLRLNLTDPNALLLMDIEPFDNNTEKPKARIVEIPSKMVFNYVEENDKLVEVIYGIPVEYEVKGETKEGIALYKITDDKIVWLQPTDPEKVGDVESFDKLTEESEFYYSKSTLYEVNRAENTLKYIPAMRAGYIKAIETKGETFEAIIEASMPYYEKMLDRNSEFDLANALHAFPQKVGYYPACTNSTCIQGQDTNGNECKTCGGTGYIESIHTSGQDYVGVPYPKKGEEIIDVSKIFQYLAVDTKTLEYQEKELTRLEEAIFDCIFNQDIFSKVHITQSATEVNSKKDNVNDTLYSFAQGYAQLWVFMVKTLATYNDYTTDLNVAYIFPNDFKLETLDELIENYSTAVKSNAPSFVVNGISADIARKVFVDNEVALAKFNIKQMVDPFAGESKDQITMKMNSAFIDPDDVYLYSNLNRVLREIEKDDPEYFLKEFNLIRDAVYEKVKELRAVNFNTLPG